MNRLEQPKLTSRTQLEKTLSALRNGVTLKRPRRLLAGDIGGTKTILRLVELSNDLSLKTIYEVKYLSSNFPDLVPMVRQFLALLEGYLPEVACFAVAGAVVNNTSRLTNLNWYLDNQRLEVELGIEKVSLLNDFAANCYGVLGLEAAEQHTLQTGKPSHTAPIAVTGAGTGLGAGFLVPQGNQYQIFASEGGHADFAPRSELELQLLAYFQDKYQTDHVSVERLVSGQGIADVYQFLRLQRVFPESPEIAQAIAQAKEKVEPAAIISHAALERRDRLCERTLEIFVETYGAQAGNLALTLLPFGGLYLAGGIAAKILPLMKEERFVNAFRSKGRLSPILEQIPLHVILNPNVGLMGSVLYGYANLQY